MKPLVSVIMPVRNGAAHLQDALESVRSQTVTDFELLVTDDSSTDGSRELLAKFASNDDRVRIFRRNGQRHAAAARNLALSRARGQYAAFLDADDIWLSDKLERQLEFMRAKDAYFSYTAYEKIDADGRRRDRIVSVPTRLDYPALLKGCAIGCSTAVIDIRRTGPLQMPAIRRGHDYACWLRLVRRFGPAQGLNEPLGFYREHPGSLSSNKFRKAAMNWRIYRQEEGLSFLRATACMGAYIYHGVRKRLI
jgi:teichuronic acid biosynthesis glycosyltransferase TuaG